MLQTQRSCVNGRLLVSLWGTTDIKPDPDGIYVEEKSLTIVRFAGVSEVFRTSVHTTLRATWLTTSSVVGDRLY